MIKIAALLLCFLLLTGCGTAVEEPEFEAAYIGEYIKIAGRAPDPVLRIGCDELEGGFCSFWAKTDGDRLASDLVNVHLVTVDRSGEVLYNAAQGEKRGFHGAEYEYKGIADLDIERTSQGGAVYTWELRDDIYFSDGVQLTADDVLFSLSLALETGCGLDDVDVEGLKPYLAGTDAETYEKYRKTAENYLETPAKEPDEYEKFFYDSALPEAWMDECKCIVDYCLELTDDYAEKFGYSSEEIHADEHLACAFAMYMWGFGKLEDGYIKGLGTGENRRPEEADMDFFLNEARNLYPDPDEFFRHEKTGTEKMSILENAVEKYIAFRSSKDNKSTAGIIGIEKVDDFTVKICTSSYKASDVFSMDIPILPLHYYGNTENFDPEHGKYGFTEEDIEKIKDKCRKPLGAGPYAFKSFDGETVTLTANMYSADQPKTAKVKIISSRNEANGVLTDEYDLYFGEAAGQGTYVSYENAGYGYIGINCEKVNVGGKPYTDESRALRMALCTVLSAYRESSAEYYGDSAIKTASRICRNSWLYSETTAEYGENDAAAAAVGYLRAAGYAWDADQEKFTAAPRGAKLSYSIMIPGNGKGAHPAYRTAEKASELLARIGIELKISDLTDPNVLMRSLENGTVQLWAAAWSGTCDPDLYQIYSSDNFPGNGTGLNFYRLKDDKLDELLAQARSTVSFEIRKKLYGECMVLIDSAAAEVPLYRKLDALFYGKRVDEMSVQPVSAYYAPSNIVKDIKMK